MLLIIFWMMLLGPSALGEACECAVCSVRVREGEGPNFFLLIVFPIASIFLGCMSRSPVRHRGKCDRVVLERVKEERITQ